jgi:ABC-2 type transport system ATP-binding protein
MGNKKRLAFQLSQKVSLEKLQKYGNVCQFKDYEVTFEVGHSEINACASLVLKELPVVDFNVSDVPIEEGISLFYEKTGGGIYDRE